MNKSHYILITLLLLVNNLHSSLNPLTNLLKIDSTPNSFTAMLEKQLNIMNNDKKNLESNLLDIKNQILNNNKELKNSKEKLEINKVDHEFLNQKISFLSQTILVQTDLENIISQIINLLDEHSKLLEEYKADPEFKSKNFILPTKSLYTFTDLSKINDQLIEQEAALKELEEKSKKINLDLVNRQKMQVLALGEYNEKKKQQNEFSFKKDIEIENYSNLNTTQKGELLDLEVNLLKLKKELEDLKVKEFEQKRNFLVDTKIKIAKIQLEILQNEYNKIKKNFQVDLQTKKNFEETFEKERQESEIKQKAYKDGINGLNSTQEILEKELAAYKKQINLTDNDLKDITEWTQKPDSINSWQILLNAQKIISKIEAIKIHKDQLEAQITLEKTKIKRADVTNKIINTWYKLTTEKYNTIPILTKEIKFYESIKNDLQSLQTVILEKRAIGNINLTTNSKLLDNIKALIQGLKNQHNSIFLNYTTEYKIYFSKIQTYEEDIIIKGEPLTKILECYSQSFDILNKTNQKIERIILELNSLISQNTLPSIFWQSLKDFIPHFTAFLLKLKNMWTDYIHTFSIPSFNSIIDYLSINFYEIIYLLLQIIIFFLIFILIKLYMTDFIKILKSIGPEHGLGYIVDNVIISILKFINLNLFNLFWWFLIFIIIKYIFARYIFIKATFLLISIPYLLWYARKLIIYISPQPNKLFQQNYYKRFITILTILSYTTITIFLLKESFLSINSEQSSIPTILSAFNFIVLQICLVFLIERDQILNLIPKTSTIWQKIYFLVEKYYYLLFSIIIFLIFMSNPYIGYGAYFFKISSKLLLITLLIAILSLVQGQIKKLSTLIFFQFDGEVMKERFSSGKTFYGIFIILSFILLLSIILILSLNILGYPITLTDIIDSLHKELYSAGLDATGRRIFVTPIDFFKFITYVACGFVASYVINKLLFNKMFDLLMVNIGAQNAILSLTHYALIIISFIIGLNAVGLSSSIIYIGSAIAGLGIAGKELVADGIAYFIILIQRPIKIGDFIMFDEETKGVVRKITPRSVIIRRKNSVTVMIPNYYFMTKSLINWSSSRTFFAFDDIILTLPYSTDPIKAKELMHKVLNNNINILKNPAPVILLREFTDVGFQFLIRGFLSPDKVLDQFEIASDVRLELVRELKANNINFAIPSRIVFKT